jgi:hypothetical protein
VPGGPSRHGGSAEERRLRLENAQLKAALAEATVQLRMWQKCAEYAGKLPSVTSKPRERQRVCRFRGSLAWRGSRSAPTPHVVEHPRRLDQHLADGLRNLHSGADAARLLGASASTAANVALAVAVLLLMIPGPAAAPRNCAVPGW